MLGHLGIGVVLRQQSDDRVVAGCRPDRVGHRDAVQLALQRCQRWAFRVCRVACSGVLCTAHLSCTILSFMLGMSHY